MEDVLTSPLGPQDWTFGPGESIRYPSLIYKTRGKWQIAAVSQIHSHRVHRVHCVLNVSFSWRSLSLSMSHWLTLSYISWCSWTVQWWREWYIFHCHNNLFCWTSLHWKSWTQQGNCGNLPPRGSLLLCNRFACWSLDSYPKLNIGPLRYRDCHTVIF